MRLHTDYFETEARDDRVLVVIFLRGGADGLTLVPPHIDDAYHRARPTLAVGRPSTIDLDGYFGLNAALRPLMPLFERGELAIVHGAGSEDETRSHFEAQDFMEHGGRAAGQGGGWLGRFLRAREGTPSPLGAVALGPTWPESLRGAPGGAAIESVRDFAIGGDEQGSFAADIERLWSAKDDEIGRAARDTLGAMRRLRSVAQDIGIDSAANYPNSRFGRGLGEIAKLIRADVGLVASTIDLDGWDTHFGQGALIDSLMRDLSQGVAAFLDDLGGARDRVSIVCMTEFGRRLRENSSLGTDHGLASVMFIIGSEIRGGRIISQWRGLEADNLVGPGDIPVGVNYRDVLAPVLNLHTPGADLARVFPAYPLEPVDLV